MNSKNFVTVNASYTRSINLERDIESDTVLDSYIPTGRAISTIARISETISNKATPRSWALVGPYGSGKSAFSLFLSHLLGGRNDPLFSTAIQKLSERDRKLSKAFQLKVGDKSFFHILIVGGPESLSQKLVRSLKDSIQSEKLFSKTYVKNAVARLDKLLSRDVIACSDIVSEFECLQIELLSKEFCGLLLVIDELGKVLEHEVRNPNANEIHLLQVLAEHAAKASEVPLQLVVLMHQAFELYTRNVREILKNEWQKVQGRFETISFVESSEQSMRLLSVAIDQELPKPIQQLIKRQVKDMAKLLDEEGALPNSIGILDAEDIFAKCFPLHPITLLLLPVLCQKIAQNERTLFSYLGSAEPHGFRDSISRIEISEDVLSWILPWEIYEYFIQNQPSNVLDGVSRRRWNEVGAAVDRLGNGFPEEEKLLKTIGLMNIIGAQGGLKASRKLLSLVDCNLPVKQKMIEKGVKFLLENSLITHRKFSDEYRVWQGSDFDFDLALKTTLAESGRVNLVQRLNSHSKAAPIVARRYTIETGTLRYFKPFFVSVNELDNLKPALEPELVYVLADYKNNLVHLEQHLLNLSEQYYSRIFVIVEVTDELYEFVSEVNAIQAIQNSNPLLANDPIAQRELVERKSQAQLLEESHLSELLDDPHRLTWFQGGKQLPIQTQRQLQEQLTSLLRHRIFPDAPNIFNELINRNSPSATANSAKKKLLVAMLDSSNLEDLGIEKYPAEKAMYLALLKAPGLHRKDHESGFWGFFEPLKSNDREFNLRPVWLHIVGFFKRAEKHAEPISKLYAELGASPFGVKEGVKPILFMAAYLAMQNEVAVFDQGIFSGVFTLEMLEKLLKDPSNIKVQNTSIDGMRMEVFKQYSNVLMDGKKSGDSILPIAKIVARNMKDLPEYSQKTKQVSEEAQAIRTLFAKAESPGDLLFRALPLACGFNPDQLNSKELAQKYVVSLKEKLIELQLAYPNMLSAVARRLSDSFGYSIVLDLPDLRKTLTGRATGLENYTVDVGGLKAFVLRLQEGHGDDILWLERVAAFLAKKPANKWSDTDLQLLELRLSDLIRSFDNLEKLRHEYGEKALDSESDFEVVLIHTMHAQKPEMKEFVRIRKSRMQQLQSQETSLRNVLSELTEKEDRLALLARMIEETCLVK